MKIFFEHILPETNSSPPAESCNVSGRVSSNSTNPYRWPSRWLTGATRPYKWSYNLITSVFGPTLYGCIQHFSPGFPDIITTEFGVQLHQLGIGGQRCWTEIRRQFATPRERTVSACGCSRLGWVIFTHPTPSWENDSFLFWGWQSWPIFRGEDVRFWGICNGKGDCCAFLFGRW